MARPEKFGLDYFPLDVDIFESDKMLAISGEFAVKGEIITLRLLCEIYRNGYFVEYSELLKNKLARLSGLSGNLIDEVVGKLVKYGFFDESVFREHSVLTSKGIQKRYLEAVKRRKNVLCQHYWLLKGVNVYNNSTSARVNDDISTQKKREEKKVKESEERSHARAHEVVPDSIPERPWQSYSIDELSQQLINSTSWKESVCMQYQLKPNEVDPWLTRFAGHLKASGEETKNIRDAKKHFSSWLRIQLDMQKQNSKSNQSMPADNAWRFDKNIKPEYPGDWVWLEGLNRWGDKMNMNKSEKRRLGLL